MTSVEMCLVLDINNERLSLWNWTILTTPEQHPVTTSGLESRCLSLLKEENRQRMWQKYGTVFPICNHSRFVFYLRVLVTPSSTDWSDRTSAQRRTSTRCNSCKITSKVTCTPGRPWSPLMGAAGPDGVLLPCDQLHAPQQWTLPEHQRSFPGSALQKHGRRITGNNTQ